MLCMIRIVEERGGREYLVGKVAKRHERIYLNTKVGMPRLEKSGPRKTGAAGRRSRREKTRAGGSRAS